MPILNTSNYTKHALFGFAKIVSFCVLACMANIIAAGTASAQCVSITSYGGGPTSTGIMNVTALANAFAALPTNGGCISYPAGKSTFASSVTLSVPTSPPNHIYSLTILGSGADSAILYFPTSDGIAINTSAATQSVHVRDLTFSTGTAGGTTALTVQNSVGLGAIYGSDIFRTAFRGDDGGGLVDYWGTGVNIVGQSNVNFDSVNFLGNSSGNGGVGISLSGNTGAANSPYGVIYNIAKCGFDFM